MRPSLFVFLAAVLVFAFASVATSIEHRQLKRIPGELPLVEPQDIGRVESITYLMNYCVNNSYYLPVPHPTYGDSEVAQRFTICGPDSIEFVLVPIYDDGTGTFGNDDIYCTIYSDDGNGRPGEVIAQDVAPAGTWQPSGATFFDYPGKIAVGCNFHIGVSTSATVDFENIILDDGSNGQGRASLKWDGQWWSFYESWGVDANINIWVMLALRDNEYVGTNHKMHWPQYPDTTGWDVMAGSPFILADDWMCSETGWIKNIHFWGSWLSVPFGTPILVDSFHVKIHSDIPDPDGPGPEFSMPGPVLWEKTCTLYRMPGINFHSNLQPIPSSTPEGWYDPMYNNIIYEDHDEYDRYEICLDTMDSFYQLKDNVYWLSISAFVHEIEPPNFWGWKSTKDNWNDNAVWAPGGPPYNWTKICEPGYPYIPGDVNNDGVVNVADVSFYTNYLFGGAPPPYVIPGTNFHPAADCNGNCIEPQSADLTALSSGAATYCPDYPPEGTVPLDLSFVIGTGCEEEFICDCVPGEADGNAGINVLDIVYLINFKFKGGPPPVPYQVCSGDANCNCEMNLLDIVFLVNYKFKGGLPPCTCDDWVANCGLPLTK